MLGGAMKPARAQRRITDGLNVGGPEDAKWSYEAGRWAFRLLEGLRVGGPENAKWSYDVESQGVQKIRMQGKWPPEFPHTRCFEKVGRLSCSVLQPMSPESMIGLPARPASMQGILSQNAPDHRLAHRFGRHGFCVGSCVGFATTGEDVAPSIEIFQIKKSGAKPVKSKHVASHGRQVYPSMVAGRNLHGFVVLHDSLVFFRIPTVSATPAPRILFA